MTTADPYDFTPQPTEQDIEDCLAAAKYWQSTAQQLTDIRIAASTQWGPAGQGGLRDQLGIAPPNMVRALNEAIAACDHYHAMCTRAAAAASILQAQPTKKAGN